MLSIRNRKAAPKFLVIEFRLDGGSDIVSKHDTEPEAEAVQRQVRASGVEAWVIRTAEELAA